MYKKGIGCEKDIVKADEILALKKSYLNQVSAN
jgi:hypothetical protein